MGIFSSESTLILKNWEAVHDIFIAEKQLRKELLSFLYSIEADLKKTDWWSREWVFQKPTGVQIAISRREWKVGHDFAVWIGVENFVPESLFGYEPSAGLYVWVLVKFPNLAGKLVTQLSEKESDIIGEIDHKTSNGYVIKHALSSCFPEEVDNFEDMMRGQIVDFFTHYARILDKYRFIKESLAED